MTALPLVFDAPRARCPPRHLADLDPADRRAAVGELGPARLPGRPAGPALLRPAHRGRRRDDRPARRRPDRVRRRAAPGAAHRGPVADLRRRRPPARRCGAAHDGTLIESVLMRYPDRITLCVSSQAGCGMACPFCATGQGGLQRNLSTAEIVEQVRLAAAAARDGALGRAEAAVQRGVHGHGRAAGQLQPGAGRGAADHRPGAGRVRHLRARSVTVSTVGLVPAIDRLAAEGLQVTLAVSLHAPDDELRDTLVPVNDRWKVAEVLDAARGYADDDRPAGVDRVRADPRHQRPAVAGRPARHGAAAAHRASWCTST